jgi:glycosyltransferase involved in cell wall biosynthesis
MIFLSVIIPAFNEHQNFRAGALSKVKQYLDQVNYSYEVLLVDDGSSDDTPSLIKEFCSHDEHFHYYIRPHQGKASAISYGVDKAKGDNVLLTDFDQATPIGEIEKLLPFLNKGFDIIIGSREVKGARREKEPFYRHLMGKVFNIVVRVFALGGIADTQCGFKLLRSEVAKTLFKKLVVYKANNRKQIKYPFTGAVDVELLFLANKYHYRIAEVPIYWKHYKTERVSALRDSFKMFVDVLKLRWYALTGRYE